MSDQDTKTPPAADPASQDSEQNSKPLFSVDGRDYDQDAAVTKIKNADAFIDTLKTETKEKDQEIANLKAQLDQAKKLEDALESMKQTSNEVNDMSGNTDATTTVDVEALRAELIKQAQEAATSSVSTMKQQEIAGSNQAESIAAAKALYGSDYESKLRETGAELGLDDQAIDSMAKSNPKLFKRTFGLNTKSNTGLFADGSQNAGVTVPKPDLKNVSKHWSSTDKVGAQMSNEAAVMKMIKDAGGDYDAVARSLGVNIKNYA